MPKVSIKFIFIPALLLLNACNNNVGIQDEERAQQIADSLAEARIDSAYQAIATECDTLMKYEVPLLVKAVTAKDSQYIKQFSDSLCTYTDSIPRVEKVIRQLKIDCDSNLLQETYRRVQQLPKPKLLQRPLKKA